MNDDPGIAHIARVDPAYARIIQAVGPFTPRPPDADAFNSLARAIVFQQLAGHAARAIHGRFAALFDGQPTPEAVMQTSIDQLRSVGLSGAKAASIADLALKATDGTLPLDRLDELSDAEIVQRLTAVRGIGRWTAEMFMIFQLRRPDVWPVDDYGVRKGFAVVHGLEVPPTPKALDALGEIYRPYRSTVAWYCWRAVDTVLPGA
jgi:3-methyladenine DNA glycosylase/8-oxoguanine DNA glycosylase